MPDARTAARNELRDVLDQLPSAVERVQAASRKINRMLGLYFDIDEFEIAEFDRRRDILADAHAAYKKLKAREKDLQSLAID